MRRHLVLVRNMELGNHLELLLVSAVAAILVIRGFLVLTGYPQLGGSKLHIAHMLWGGLLMCVAIFMLLGFLSRVADRLAAVIGGVGFGMFIDEVGKFVTHDNDYFFKPSVAIMYAVFILIILIYRGVRSRRGYSQQEYLVNAVQQLEDLALYDLDEQEKARALHFLDRSGSDHPMVLALRDAIERASLTSPSREGVYPRAKRFLEELYQRIADTRGFSVLLILFFLVQLTIKSAYVFVLVFFRGLGWRQVLAFRAFERIAERTEHLAFVEWAELASSLFSAFFVFLGVLFVRRSRMLAYRMFERSILVSIFLTQVFIFYQREFSALLGLLFHLVVLAMLRVMISRESVMASLAEDD